MDKVVFSSCRALSKGIRRIAASKKKIYGVARQQKVYFPAPI
jgi:hypothetical protein